MSSVEAARVKVTQPDAGDNVYTIEQEVIDQEEFSWENYGDPNYEVDQNSLIDIDWSFGPLKYSGKVNRDSLEIQYYQTVNGLLTGPIKGNLKDGVKTKINLQYARGETVFYLKNGNEVWTHLDIKIIFDGSFDKDAKIITI